MVKDLSHNMVLVSGTCKHAIFDFANDRYIHLDGNSLDILTRALTGSVITEQEAASFAEFKKAIGADTLVFHDYAFPEPEPLRLRFAELEITQKCGYKCIHCYEGKSHREVASPLPLDKWFSLINELKEQGCNRVQFIGGEPTLHPRLKDMIDYAGTKGFDKIEIFSNLYKLSDELVEALVRNNVVVRVSVYGSDEHIHDHITGVSGSLNHTKKNIAMLIDKGITITANVVLMRENETDKAAIKDMLNSLGIDKIHFDEIREVIEGTQASHAISEAFRSKELRLNINRSYFNRSHSGIRCLCGSIYVTADGMVYPCSMERTVCYGNVCNNRLADILSAKNTKEVWTLTHDKVDKCCGCEFRYVCVDCRAEASAKGGIYSKSPTCRYDPVNGKIMK